MAINTKGNANMRPGNKKGNAPHPAPRKSGFDAQWDYANVSKTNVKIIGKK